MGNSVADQSADAFLRLLREGARNRHAKHDALLALQDRNVWLATWEPRAKGYRTLINGTGEEALAVFTGERELSTAAARFGWIGPDGAIETHVTTGAEILRHAWTREYAFVVVDIAADHSLEFEREELRAFVKHDAVTGQYKSSRPPAPDRPTRKKRSRQKSAEIKEVSVAPPSVGLAGTYGAASIIPPKRSEAPSATQPQKPPGVAPLEDPIVSLDVMLPEPDMPEITFDPVTEDSMALGDTIPPAETENATQASAPPRIDELSPQPNPAPSVAAPAQAGLVDPKPSFVPIETRPADEALKELASVLRAYPEVEWVAFCSVARPGGLVAPTLGMRVDVDYRDNVNEIVRKMTNIGRIHRMGLDTLLLDHSDLQRQARELGIVFYPWMPKRA